MNFGADCDRFHHKEDMMGKIKYDSEYISYVESGESAAVFIARDIAKEIDTNGKWIDILESEGKKNNNERWDFTHFSIELFPRKKKPDYSFCNDEEDRKYITWKTAHEDMKEQRRQGYRGKKYIIYPKLVRRKVKGEKVKSHDKSRWEWKYDIWKISKL